jgi:hypothetical protein
MKKKNEYYIVGTVQKYNRKRGKKSILLIFK